MTVQDSTPPPGFSQEYVAPVSVDIEICYQTFGDPSDEPLLLVMGLGAPMTWWAPALCEELADRGFFVIRYDNRDTGRSSRVDVPVSRGTLIRAFAGKGRARGKPAYTLSDLAADACGLLDHLGLPAAHVTGVSMGGMIAQTLAIEHPSRVLSLTSIMSTTGKRSVGWQNPRLVPVLLASRGVDREAYVASAVRTWELIGSPGYPPDPTEIRTRAGDTFDRGVSASGVMRQMLAIVHQPNRTAGLRGLTMPATAIHGTADPMVHVSGGRATAAAIPGAELVLIEAMAHDLPPALFEAFAAAIRRTADRADRSAPNSA